MTAPDSRRRDSLAALTSLVSAGAGWLYVGIAIFITFDIVARRFLGFSSQGTVEISGYILAIGIGLALPHALLTRGHIRVDAVLRRLPLTIRGYFHLLAIALLTALAWLIAFRGWEVALQSWELGSRDKTLLHIPLVLPQSVWAFGLTLFAVTGTTLLIAGAVLTRKGRFDRVEALLLSASELEQLEPHAARETSTASDTT